MTAALITPRSAAQVAGMVRIAPEPDLADLVEQHWVVRWDRRGLPALRHEVLPDPSVNLTVEPTGRLLYGPGSILLVINAFLRARRPQRDRQRALAMDAIRAMRAAPPGAHISGLAADFAVSPRTLQRLFARHVGVGPKEVLQRFRRQQAADRLVDPTVPTLAQLAVELGYFDQAHMARDFRTTLNRSPSTVAASG